MSRPTWLHAYVGLLSSIAVPVLVVTAVMTPWGSALETLPVLVILGGLIILGEITPIFISHGNDTIDIVTISSCFSVALALHGPLSVALGAQMLALIIDDLRCQRSWLKAAFNHANFIVSLTLGTPVR